MHPPVSLTAARLPEIRAALVDAYAELARTENGIALSAEPRRRLLESRRTTWKLIAECREAQLRAVEAAERLRVAMAASQALRAA